MRNFFITYRYGTKNNEFITTNKCVSSKTFTQDDIEQWLQDIADEEKPQSVVILNIAEMDCDEQKGELTLKEFVERFVAPNTLIRLWTKEKGGHKMIVHENKSICMNHQLLNNTCWQSEYNNCMALHVTDIVVNDFYSEAVNIVIELE